MSTERDGLARLRRVQEATRELLDKHPFVADQFYDAFWDFEELYKSHADQPSSVGRSPDRSGHPPKAAPDFLRHTVLSRLGHADRLRVAMFYLGGLVDSDAVSPLVPEPGDDATALRTWLWDLRKSQPADGASGTPAPSPALFPPEIAEQLLRLVTAWATEEAARRDDALRDDDAEDDLLLPADWPPNWDPPVADLVDRLRGTWLASLRVQNAWSEVESIGLHSGSAGVGGVVRVWPGLPLEVQDFASLAAHRNRRWEFREPLPDNIRRSWLDRLDYLALRVRMLRRGIDSARSAVPGVQDIMDRKADVAPDRWTYKVNRVLDELGGIIPRAREADLPIGVGRGVNPRLGELAEMLNRHRFELQAVPPNAPVERTQPADTKVDWNDAGIDPSVRAQSVIEYCGRKNRSAPELWDLLRGLHLGDTPEAVAVRRHLMRAPVNAHHLALVAQGVRAIGLQYFESSAETGILAGSLLLDAHQSGGFSSGPNGFWGEQIEGVVRMRPGQDGCLSVFATVARLASYSSGREVGLTPFPGCSQIPFVTFDTIAREIEAEAERLVPKLPEVPASASARTYPSLLRPNAWAALMALVELKAFDREQRVIIDRVSKKAIGKQPAAGDFKELIAELVQDGLAASHRGRSGGVWITQLGRDHAAQNPS